MSNVSNDPNEQGAMFESEVRCLLMSLAAMKPTQIRVKDHPRVVLQNGEVVIPDFHLAVSLLHERGHYLIECQNRERDSKSILHKIQHIRNKQPLKTFIFVYPKEIGDELERALKAEGIITRNLEEFRTFLAGIEKTVEVLEEAGQFFSSLSTENPPPDRGMIVRSR